MNNTIGPYTLSSLSPQEKTLQDLEEIYLLALEEKQFQAAIRAKDLMARIHGLIPTKKDPKKLLRLGDLSDAQIDQFIQDGKEAGYLPPG